MGEGKIPFYGELWMQSDNASGRLYNNAGSAAAAGPNRVRARPWLSKSDLEGCGPPVF